MRRTRPHRIDRPAVAAAVPALVLALVLAACGGDDDEGGGIVDRAQEAQGGDTTGTAEPSEEGDGDVGALGEALAGASGAEGASWLTGSWEGTFSCGAETPLRLTLLDVNNGPVEGFFEFGPEGQGAAEGAGSYRLRGDRTDGALSLTGLDWIEQPAGAPMYGVEADVAEDGGDQLTGTIVGDGCDSFTVERVSSDPWYAGTWRGGYICAQGRTDMTLTMEAVQGNGVEALVEFYPAEENPDVPSGSYRLAGIWADGGIQLDGVEWVEQPPGYVMVDIASNPGLAIGPDLLAGGIEDPTCEQFIMERNEG